MARIAERSDVLAVVGMTREAKLLTGAPVVVGGGDTPGLIGRLEAELRGGVAGVISFGLCGALDPALEVGDLVIGSAVADETERFAADADWATRLAAGLPEAKTCVFARAERPVATTGEKASLRDGTGAGAVDLESHAVAKLAGFFGVPFAILRAVSDEADRALPHAAQVGLGVDGRPAIGPVMASLRNNPWQLGALIRTALEAEDGFHALEHARQTLGPRLAGPEG
jgi:hopanoid-associated phosphorylase